MPETLLSVFPDPRDLLALEPEELAGIVLELAPITLQNGLFNIGWMLSPAFGPVSPSYGQEFRKPITRALAEAVTWLESQGFLIEEPEQQGRFHFISRRAQRLTSRADVATFRKGRILPVELLQPTLASKVWPLFLRGDHDVAVFQAFKEVEVSVRTAANARAAGYPDDLVGVSLMRRAFHPETGPLTDPNAVFAEREAEAALFAGAIGHAKNPTGHRDVNTPPQEAARLVVFASHLLSIVAKR